MSPELRELVVPVGWALLHFLWQGILVACLLAVALAGMHRASSRQRYVVRCLALLVMAICPLVTWLVSQPVPPSPEQAAATVTGVGSAASTIADRALPWVVSVWCAGVLLLLARLVGGCWEVRALRRRARRPLPAEWQRHFERLVRQFGVRTRACLVDSAAVVVPTVVGWFRPVVLLPARLFTGLDETQVLALIAHELAHIRRHDAIVNLVQSVIESLLFYHPAVWWVSRGIRMEREFCCDDMAVQVTGGALPYARALADLESWRGRQLQLAPSSRGGTLMDRIQRLVGEPGAADKKMLRRSLPAALALLIATGLGGGALALGDGDDASDTRRKVYRVRLAPRSNTPQRVLVLRTLSTETVPESEQAETRYEWVGPGDGHTLRWTTRSPEADRKPARRRYTVRQEQDETTEEDVGQAVYWRSLVEEDEPDSGRWRYRVDWTEGSESGRVTRRRGATREQIRERRTDRRRREAPPWFSPSRQRVRDHGSEGADRTEGAEYYWIETVEDAPETRRRYEVEVPPEERRPVIYRYVVPSDDTDDTYGVDTGSIQWHFEVQPEVNDVHQYELDTARIRTEEKIVVPIEVHVMVPEQKKVVPVRVHVTVPGEADVTQPVDLSLPQGRYRIQLVDPAAEEVDLTVDKVEDSTDLLILEELDFSREAATIDLVDIIPAQVILDPSLLDATIEYVDPATLDATIESVDLSLPDGASESIEWIQMDPDAEVFEYRVLDPEDLDHVERRVLLDSVDFVQPQELDLLLVDPAIEVAPDARGEEAAQEIEQPTGKSRKALAVL